MVKKYNVAVVGVTGLVGQMMLEVLQERNFPINNLIVLASKRSEGKIVKFKNEEFMVAETTSNSFNDIDIALFSSAEASAGIFAQYAVKAGAVVIDNSSTFRMDKDVPLVVPEVNKEALKNHKGIIANPNCSTIQLVVVLNPLHKIARIKRVVVSTYQSVSGWGKAAVDELENQIRTYVKGEKIMYNKEILPYQIAFNIIPQIDKFQDNYYTKEEMKLVNETKKIMQDDSIRVTATCVRVPVFVGHSEAVNIETEKKLSREDVIEILSKERGIVVIDDVDNLKYPLPIDAAGKDEVFVGRIREDDTIENGINLWIVSDNLRKGAATNAVQIAECLIEK